MATLNAPVPISLFFSLVERGYRMDDQIQTCEHLLLAEISEPNVNKLRVVVAEGKQQGPPRDIQTRRGMLPGALLIEVDESCRVFEVFWEKYIAYCVRREKDTLVDSNEAWVGTTFRRYSRSNFLDYVALTTNSNTAKVQHWSLICMAHLVEVVSFCSPPRVNQVNQAEAIKIIRALRESDGL
jgi:hypothetical protein